MPPLSDAYLMAMVRRMGVPPMWAEDVAQECRLAMWLKPQMIETIVARQTTINWLRHESRQATTEQLFDEHASKDATEDVRVALMDVLPAIAKLTPALRLGLALSVMGRSLTPSERVSAWRARQVLRAQSYAK